jgi:hypothetical protein
MGALTEYLERALHRDAEGDEGQPVDVVVARAGDSLRSVCLHLAIDAWANEPDKAKRLAIHNLVACATGRWDRAILAKKLAADDAR